MLLAMKTAYELAMERMGGVKKYTEAQKKQFAEVDRRCDAEAAEARLRAADHLQKLSENDEKSEKEREQVTTRLAEELARIERKREKKKEEIRSGK